MDMYSLESYIRPRDRHRQQVAAVYGLNMRGKQESEIARMRERLLGSWDKGLIRKALITK